MDKSQERVLTDGLYQAYANLCREHGISVPISDEDYRKLSDADAARAVRALKDLARTPTT